MFCEADGRGGDTYKKQKWEVIMKHEGGGGDMLIRLLHKTQKSQLQKVVYGIARFNNHLVAGFGNFYNGRSMERTIFLRIKHHAFTNNT